MRAAATLILAVVLFGAGWFGHSLAARRESAAMARAESQARPSLPPPVLAATTLHVELNQAQLDEVAQRLAARLGPVALPAPPPAAAPAPARAPERSAAQREALSRAAHRADQALARGRMDVEDVRELRRDLAQLDAEEASELRRKLIVAINLRKLVPPSDPEMALP